MAGEASRNNGKLGGRPAGSKAQHTIAAEAARAELIKRVADNIGPLFEALYDKAKNGDVSAIKELFDRAFGKSPQALVGSDGGDLKIIFDQVFNNNSVANDE